MRYLPVMGVTTHDIADTQGADRDGGTRKHKGLDIFAAHGTGVVAVEGGTVVKSGDSGGKGGLRVWVQDDKGMFHYYAHLSAINVKNGDKVVAGQRLGGVGITGNAKNTPPHLHYSVNPTGTSSEGDFDDYQYLMGANTAPTKTPQPTDSTEAMAQRHNQELAKQEAEMTPQDYRELQKDTIGGIMASVSRAARDSNLGAGQSLDIHKMFGFDQEVS